MSEWRSMADLYRDFVYLTAADGAQAAGMDYSEFVRALPERIGEYLQYREWDTRGVVLADYYMDFTHMHDEDPSILEVMRQRIRIAATEAA